jgi:hypothetical protein
MQAQRTGNPEAVRAAWAATRGNAFGFSVKVKENYDCVTVTI